ATSVAALLNAYLLYRGLRANGVVGHMHGWRTLLLRFGIANGIMALLLYRMERPLTWWLEADTVLRAGWLALTIVAAAAVYFAVLVLTGLRPSHLRLGH